MNRRGFLKLIGTAVALGVFDFDKNKKAVAGVIEKIGPVLDQITPEVPVVEAPDVVKKIEATKTIDVVETIEAVEIEIDTEEVVLEETVTPNIEISLEDSLPELTSTPEVEKIRLSFESEPSFERPFKYKDINDVITELNLNLGDLFMPQQDKIKYFEAIATSEEILPIFTPQVAKWSEIVARKCFEYNIEHPKNKINPNVILSIISLESQGNPNAQSPAGALGLMQVTPWAYAEGFFGKYNSKNILVPENNLEVGIAFFGDIIKRSKDLGLEGIESLQYAVMEYNGGPKNASRFFKTKRATDINGIDSDLFKIDSDEKIISFLRSFYGNAKDYFTYGTNLVKKETLLYKENFTRFCVVSQISNNLLKKGYSEEQVRVMLSESLLFKSLVAFAYRNKREVVSRDGNISYFELKSIFDRVSSPNFDPTSVPEVDKNTAKNPANLVMELIYN